VTPDQVIAAIQSEGGQVWLLGDGSLRYRLPENAGLDLLSVLRAHREAICQLLKSSATATEVVGENKPRRCYVHPSSHEDWWLRGEDMICGKCHPNPATLIRAAAINQHHQEQEWPAARRRRTNRHVHGFSKQALAQIKAFAASKQNRGPDGRPVKPLYTSPADLPVRQAGVEE
jgi:hypothetical protein